MSEHVSPLLKTFQMDSHLEAEAKAPTETLQIYTALHADPTSPSSPVLAQVYFRVLTLIFLSGMLLAPDIL